MSAPAAMRYFTREALRDLWDRRSVTLLSMATIASSLFLVGLFLLAARGAGTLLTRWGDELGVTVFLSDGISTDEMKTIEEQIASSDEVRRFELIGREAALERFRADFPDLADLPAFFEESPFPVSFEIQMRAEHGSPEQITAFAGTFQEVAGVQDVRFDAQWIERLRWLLRMGAIGGAVVGGVLLGAAVLTISAVVRMGVYERRDEIEVLRMVGANPGFIRAPFLIEGALQGIFGGMAATAGIAVSWVFLVRGTGFGSKPVISEMFGTFINPLDALFLLTVGGVLGLTGSLLAGRG